MNYTDDEICQKHLAATSEERPCRECLSEELTKTKQLLATAVEIIESIIAFII